MKQNCELSQFSNLPDKDRQRQKMVNEFARFLPDISPDFSYLASVATFLAL